MLDQSSRRFTRSNWEIGNAGRRRRARTSSLLGRQGCRLRTWGSAPLASVQEAAGLQQDSTEHLFGEPAGGCVLLAGMEEANECRLAGTGAVQLVVTEDEAGAAGDCALIAPLDYPCRATMASPPARGTPPIRRMFRDVWRVATRSKRPAVTSKKPQSRTLKPCAKWTSPFPNHSR